ncbi:cytochrome P450 [Dactylosporangium vinaceum]|uniref:Cytochrome P450 n=1 Tax=Dactylosporangium vinaceum TaxID=53362 RepID=A0ABV5MJ44_9ACTN|nr:cytochrome P450 [Dactylosporangium vinaceum]UAB93698.1 cytochrome P450 [Dactylosporangium vinaceum]
MIAMTESAFGVRSASPATLGGSLAAIGRDRPVVFDELMGAPLVLRHRDVSAALRDTATFSTRFYGMGPMSSAMIALDGPEHARRRRIHNRFFSPGATAQYARIVEPIAQQTFGSLPAALDLVGERIAAYPMRVFMGLLGVPDDPGEQGLTWVRTIMAWLAAPMDPSLAGPGEAALAQLQAYTTALVEAERARPGDNLLGQIVQAHVDEGGYTPEAVTVAVISLLLGGFETTVQLLTGTIAALLLHPGVLREVQAESALLDAALDESLRWAAPTAGLYRLVLRDTEIAGTPVAAGGMVYLAIAGAHFDESVYPDPHEFRLDRPGPHLGFGVGPHYCIGAPLARLEARTALSALFTGAPRLRLDPSAPLDFHYSARGFPQHGADTLRVLTN